jgi:hypothetical protein
MLESETGRRRLALLLTVGGIALLLFAAATYIAWERSRLPPPDQPLTDEQKQELRTRVTGPTIVLFSVIGVSAVFLLLLAAFRAWSRAYREQLLRPPRPSTTVEDVWNMHRLPDDPGGALDDSANPPPDPDEDPPSG